MSLLQNATIVELLLLACQRKKILSGVGTAT